MKAVLSIGIIYLVCRSDDCLVETLWWDHFCNKDSTVMLHDSICFKVFKNNLISFAILSWGNVGQLCMIVTSDLDNTTTL